MAFRLTKDQLNTLATAESTLREAVGDLRSEFDERSEKWQGSDRAANVLEWIDALEDVADSLDNLAASPED